MDGFNVGKILAGLRNPELYLRKLREGDSGIDANKSFNSTFTTQKQFVPSPQLAQALSNQIQMNQIASMDRSVYIRNLVIYS